MEKYTDLNFQHSKLLYDAVINKNKIYFGFLKNITDTTILNKYNNDIIDKILYTENFDFIDKFYPGLKSDTLVNIHNQYIESPKYILSGHGQITQNNKSGGSS